MNLLLVDNRVSKPDFVVSACLSNIIPVIFDYHNDTVESLIQKIPDGPFISLGIFQENYNEPTYQLLSTMEPASLTFSPETPDFSSWTSLVDFFRAIREKTGISIIDMMGCNIGSDANWLAAIGYIRDTLGIEIASSVDATGGEAAGGNWILETVNTDLVGKYFTEEIRSYEFVLGPTSAHSILLTASGEVYSMGSNTGGCSGLGTAYIGYSTITEPMRLGVSGITGISYGTSNTFLLNSSGQVLCCGANANGQLGLGNTTQQTDLSFVRADANTRLSNVAAVAAGANHSVFLLTDGSALACGLNTSGQLGDGTLTQRTYPVAMRTISETQQPTATRLMHYKFDGNLVNEVTGTTTDASLTGGCALTNTISKFGTGSLATTQENPGSLGLPQITLSNKNLTVSFWFYQTVSSTGGAYRYVWWINYSTPTSTSFLLYTVGSSLRFSKIVGSEAITTITNSFSNNVWNHIAIVSSDASNNIKIYLNNSAPITISYALDTTTYTLHNLLGTVSPSGYLDDYRVYTEALDATNIGYLYNNNTTIFVPANLNTVKSISQISAGSFHTLLKTTTNEAFSCGRNLNGQLGLGTLVDSSYALSVKINNTTFLTGISDIAAGGSHSLALTTSATVYSWGANTDGQLGRNNNVDASYAALVLTSAAATLSGITQVAAGTSHSLFLTASGTVFACGLNTSGQLGNNTTTSSNQLVSVLNPAGTAALTGITRIFASANSSFFLDVSSVLYGCGSNASNQLGFPNSGTTNYTLPVQIPLVDFGRAKAGGYTPIYNRLVGAEPWQQQYYGSTGTLDLVNAGYTTTQLATAGITASTLKTSGASYRQLLGTGYSRALINNTFTGRNVAEGITSTTGYLMENSVLDPPQAFTISGRTTSSLTVGTITAPSVSTGLLRYNARAVPVTGGTTVIADVSAGNPISGLATGKIYSVRARSVNAAGNSVYGLPVLNSTSLTLPSLSISDTFSTGVIINYSSLPTQDCSYILTSIPNTNQYILPSGSTSRMFAGLSPDISYNFVLDASNIYTKTSSSISAITAKRYDTNNITVTNAFTGQPTSSLGIALSGNLSRAVSIVYNGTIRYATFSTGSWSAFTNIDATSRYYTGVALTDDGSIGVACVGLLGAATGYVYRFTWSGTAYGSFIQADDNVARNYKSIAIIPSGNRIVACVQNDGIYYADWNSGTSKYVFTKTLENRATPFLGISIAKDSSRIVYTGGAAASFVYYADWNGTNYSNGIQIGTTGRFWQSCQLSFNKDVIWATIFNSTQTLWFSYWNSSTSTYDEFTAATAAGIPQNIDAWNLWLSPSGRVIFSAPQNSAIYYRFDIPVL